MNKFQKGFTMVELIFVIVILGILAAVAIPKLVATRDDAIVSRFAKNFSILITDISAYQISQGKYEKKISDMTNVRVEDSSDYHAKLLMNRDSCIEVIVYEKDDLANNIRAGMFEVKTANSNNNRLCQAALQTPTISTFLKNGKYVFLGDHIVY